jgi:hypothetical protein
MSIEHCDDLSWLSRKRQSHKQDGEALMPQYGLRIVSASGDPAMAFGLPLIWTDNGPSF